MKSFLTITLTIFILSLSFAQKDSFNISKWKSYPVPTNQDTLMKYNGSKVEWQVEKIGKQVYGKLSKNKQADKQIPFEIKPLTEREKDELTGDISFIKVDNGYLISFWRGEFGGNLYWFDNVGEKRKSIARAMITQFIKRDDKIYAIAGLAHMGISNGGIIEIRKENENWKLFHYVNLNDAPYAVDMDKSKSFVVITSNHLYSIDTNKQIDTLITKGFWELLYPTSLTIEKNIVFVGMRQGIFKFNLATRKEQWLMRD